MNLTLKTTTLGRYLSSEPGWNTFSIWVFLFKGLPMNVSEFAKDWDHEQVVFCRDQETGLKAIIAIHNTTLGPALGGCRFWDYES